MSVLGEISTLQRMAWIKWKRSEVTGCICREAGGVPSHRPFLEVPGGEELFILYRTGFR